MTKEFTVIAYSSNPGYYNMVCRLANLCTSWNIPFKPYNREWVEQQKEYAEHKDIFAAHHGGGYWAWKPLIILDALKICDTIVYLDSSVVPQNKQCILDIVSAVDKITASQYFEINKAWTKRSCFIEMNCDSEDYWNTSQVWAGVVVATIASKDIVEEWRDYCLQDIVTDNPSPNNFPEFRFHRHDQSILTNLLVRHKQLPTRTTGFYDVIDYTGKKISL